MKGGVNGIEVETTDEELIDLGLGVARGLLGEDDILEWIINHS